MLEDPTTLDSLGWEVLKKALNQRVVAGRPRFIPSMVNRVWIVETDVRPVIVKRFLSGKCDTEFEALLQARTAGLTVPYPLAKEGDYLVTEFISGESCDVLIHKMFSTSAAEGLGRWLAAFHDKMSSDGTKRIMHDAVPSNFIMHDGVVHGFDLEDTKHGDPLEDVGRLAASIIGNEPFFTPIKFELCLQMLRSYGSSLGTDVVDRSRMFVSKHLRLDSRRKPLFRRTIVRAAEAIEKGWPPLR
jgi:aminoglycoside phosphotransferase (APT) family kinase protein